MSDSQYQPDEFLLDLVDDDWRKDRLPDDDVMVPVECLPDTEPDNGKSHETLAEAEQKWADLALNALRGENPPQNPANG